LRILAANAITCVKDLVEFVLLVPLAVWPA